MRRKGRDGDGVGAETGDREAGGDQGLPAGCHSSDGGAESGEGNQRGQDGGAAATAASAVAPAAQLSECNSSVEGGGQRTSGDTGRCDTASPSAGKREGGGGNRLDTSSGQGLGLDSIRRMTDWRRIGEGIAEPAGGADAVWHRVKELLEGEVAAGGRRGFQGTGGGDGGAERRPEKVEHDMRGEAVLEKRREAVLEAVRWAWKVRVPFLVCLYFTTDCRFMGTLR